jgi:nucleotide-binding universal stress UspA family protein
MSATIPQAALALRNILLATDFSSCSDHALLHAVAIAHHYGSTLHLAHIVQPALFSMLPPDGYMGTVEAENVTVEKARADAHKLLTDVLRSTHCENLKHHTWVQLGVIGETLRAIIQREHIDLIIVGTHGRTGLRKVVLGSVAEEIFRHASCPVLTVGPHSWRSNPPAVHLQRVLFPTDLSADSARALPITIAIASKFSAPLTLLHVVERLDSEAAHDRLRVIAALEEQMREMVLSAGPMPPDTTFQVAFGDVADCIIDSAASLRVDLVAFGLKAPDTYVDRLPWMHAYKVVCEVACPVLTLRGA